MDYTSHFHQIFLKEAKYDKTGYKEQSSKSPYLAYLHEVLIAYIHRLVIYIVKLKELGITNNVIKEHIIDTFSGGVINIEYTEENFFKFAIRIYDDMVQAKELYVSVCKRNNIEMKIPKTKLDIKNPRNVNFSDMIELGQKFFNAKYAGFNPEQMGFIELYQNLAISLFINLVELRELGVDDEQAYEAILVLFSRKSTYVPMMQKILMKLTVILAQNDNRLLRKIYEIKKEKYGEITATEISTSVRPNKCILISGPDLNALEVLLEATKDKGIDIYTHGYMFAAHLYPKFKTYPHLIGHFGGELENYMFDFSEFPGAIFLTKHSFINIESFYHGIIYTADVFAPKGVGIIKDNHFEPLIQSALRAKGFMEEIKRPPIKLILSEKDVLKKINEIAQKIKNGQIKYFFAIGSSNHTEAQREYFEQFLNLLGNDCFVLSFSYFNKKDNVLYVQTYDTFPFLYNSLDILTRKINIEKLNPIILFTKCGEHMLSNLVYMKQIGIKKIYFADCSTSLLNPTLIDSTRKLFGVKNYTTPENDLKDMLAG